MTQSRTHNCGELRLAHAGQQVRIVGWLENVREVGNNFAFLVLRDFYGTTQVVVETAEIMAAGAFVQGSTMELSADGPIREPYAVYFQGGLTWYHAKLGILMSLQKLIDAGIVTL